MSHGALPNLRPSDAEDPVVAVLLWVIAIGTIAALFVVPKLAHGAESGARDAVLKGAAGAVLLLGSYFAARTLKQTRADQRAQRALTAIQLLGDENPAVQVGALWVLVALAKSSEGRRDKNELYAVRRALQVASCPEVAVHLVSKEASRALSSLPAVRDSE